MNTSKINWHSVRTISLVVVTLAVNILAIFHSLVSPHAAEIIDSITPVLLYLEHALAGNSASPSEPNAAVTQ